MNKFLDILHYLIDNIFSQPGIFLGILVFIGFKLLRKSTVDAYISFVKTAVGYMIMSVGSGALVTSLRPVINAFNLKYHMNAYVADGYFAIPNLNDHLSKLGVAASWIFISFLIGLAWNVVLCAFSKISKVRTLNTTGHLIVLQPMNILFIIVSFCTGLPLVWASMLNGILMGTYWGVFSNMTVEPTQDLTEGAGFAIGHQQMFGIWVADKVSACIGGKKAKRFEEIKLPGFLSIFNDNISATATLMFIFFGVILYIIGPEFMAKGIENSGYTAGSSFFFYVLKTTLTFVVNIQVLLFGVKMFVSEISTAFQGISERLLKGVMPALDIAVTFGFATATTISMGFIFGIIGQLIGIIGLLVLKSPILLITGFVPVFFDNAGLAIYANRKGGIKAAIVISLFSGFIQIVGGAVCIGYLGLFNGWGGWFGNLDWDTTFIPIYILIKQLAVPGIIISILLMLAIPQLQYRRNKKHYFAYVTDYEKVKAEQNQGERRYD